MYTNDERHNMSKNSDIPTKQEGNNTTSDDHGKHTKASSSSTWLRLKDPRIVRVSRAFGGKDRHSKVCTIRGLRDRRVRLSVPTAIQLYDLQDKLGLNQPSKVVDWLLNVAKNEIDELPPLPMPVPGNFGLNPQSMLTSSHEFGASQSNSIDNWEGSSGLSRPNFWNPDAFWRAKSKEVAGDHDTISGKENWAKRDQKEREEENEGHDGGGAQIPFNNFLPGFLNNVMPYGSYYHLEPTNFHLSNSGSHVTSQSEDVGNFNAVLLPPTLSLSSGSQSFFPSQVSNFQMLSSSSSQGLLLSNSLAPPQYSSISQSMRPLHFSMAPKLLSQNNSSGSHHPDKYQEFPPK